MRLSRRLIAMLAPIVALAISSPASASLILALDLPTLVARSEQISVVDVVSTKADWNAEHDRIITTIDVNVVDCWKGAAAPGSHVKIEQVGGTVGELTMRIEGMPHFQRGERALLFLRGKPDHASVVGMSQGKRPLSREAGRWMVSAPDRGGADFVPTTPASKSIFTVRPRPVEDLRRDVRALVGAR